MKARYKGKMYDLEKPYTSTLKGKKKMVFVKDKRGKVHIIHFGAVGYQNNYSERAWCSYLTRSAGIRDGKGNLTKNNKLSPNYWSRKVLWAGRKGWKCK